MKSQLKLTKKHQSIISKCLAEAGYPAALARALGVSGSVINGWDSPGRKWSWDTWISLVEYARSEGIVGPYFDPITLRDPPAGGEWSAEVREAAWMLDHLDDDERRRMLDEIAATYGRSVARGGAAG